MKKIITAICVLLCIYAVSEGSLFRKKIYEMDEYKLDNPSDPYSVAYQGYEVLERSQQLLIVNSNELLNGETLIVRMTNIGWKPKKYRQSEDISTLDSKGFSEMPDSRILEYTIDAVAAIHLVYTDLELFNGSNVRMTNRFTYISNDFVYDASRPSAGVDISNPVDGEVYAAYMNLTVVADVYNMVADFVVFSNEYNDSFFSAYYDSNKPFQCTITNLLEGTYDFRAYAHSGSDVRVSSYVSITVEEASNYPPVVSIFFPLSQSKYPSGSMLTLKADAYDRDGSNKIPASLVEFYSQGVLLGTGAFVSNSNYEAGGYFYLGVSNLSAGERSFTALAKDSEGASNFSPPITVTVSDIPLKTSYEPIVWSNFYFETTNDNLSYYYPCRIDTLRDGSGAYIGVGSTASDLNLYRIDTSGNVVWSNRHSSSSYRYYTGFDMTETDDGSLFLAASVYPPYSGSYKMLAFMKYSSDGRLLWDTTYNQNYHEYIYSVGETTNSYVAAGHRDFYTAGTTQFIFLFDKNTGKLTREIYFPHLNSSGTTNSTRLTSLLVLNDGSFLAACKYDNDYSYFVRVDSNSNVSWTSNLPTDFYDGGYAGVYDMCLSEDGGVYYLRYLRQGSWSSHKLAVGKMNPENGFVLWEKTYSGIWNYYMYDTGLDMSIKLAGDGGFLAALTYHDTNTSKSNDYWLMKFDTEGSVVWSKTYGGFSNDNVFDMDIDSSAGVYLVGNSASFESNYPYITPYKTWIIKTGGSTNISTIPTVSITSPTNSSVFVEGDIITISASASDSDYSIKWVDFYTNGFSAFRDTNSPYGVSLTNMEFGTHTISAWVYDSGGGVGMSSPITINIQGFAAVYTNTIGAEFKKIRAGTYTYKSYQYDNYGTTTIYHTNSLTNFYISTYEVTYALWTNVYSWATNNGFTFFSEGYMGSSNYTNVIFTDQHPVVYITWYDVAIWCNALSKKEGRFPCYYIDSGHTTLYTNGTWEIRRDYIAWQSNGYRMPTEAEWEYSYRGGTTNGFYWTELDLTGDYAWYSGNSGSHTAAVGTRKPNLYGLYDMAGNVSEWCSDWYGYLPTNSTFYQDYRGLEIEATRSYRGGSYSQTTNYQEADDRFSATPNSRGIERGFRLVLGAP